MKSNLGHLESAAGMAAITKVLLQMQNKQLVPSLHAQILNSHINFADTPFYVQRELKSWDNPVIRQEGREINYPRRAGISAFGAGGANAHVILEEYTGRQEGVVSSDKGPQIILLSALNEERLHVYALDMLSFLDGDDESVEVKRLK